MNYHVAAFIQDVEAELHIGLRNQVWRLFWPLDKKDIMSIKLIAESGCFPFFLIVKTVQVKVS